MKNIPVLVNDMLLLDNVLDTEYKYCHNPIIIGIATKDSDTKRQYFVYNTNEKGIIDWVEEKDSFNEALLFARKMYKGKLEAYYHLSKNEKKENEELEKQIHEEITQEVFRQLLIKNNIANDYFMVFEDNFEFKKDEYGPFGGAIYIFKDSNNVWNVWEDVDYEVFMGCFRGRHADVKQFASQEQAYIDAAKRRNLNISVQDLIYDINDIQSMLNIVQSAKSFLKIRIDLYQSENNASKLTQRYLLLETFEKELLEKNNSVEKELVKKKK